MISVINENQTEIPSMQMHQITIEYHLVIHSQIEIIKYYYLQK